MKRAYQREFKQKFAKLYKNLQAINMKWTRLIVVTIKCGRLWGRKRNK